ncbi:MAG: nucleotidyltransferase domain-containing protein [Thermodesulfovibrionales bacterium]|nr:nucleotidyltransferase domain-containing protein [Thermodesulfovibrionales bacterium]MDP3112542.1 nucleotidyltransferase domain-containing protein [Thermodesulfovibrionales bacterium]
MADIALILSKLKNGLAEIYGSRLHTLNVYGSYARNEGVSGSDIDVALVLDDFEDSWTEIECTGALVSRISLEHNVVISILPIRERHWKERQSPLLINIRKESVAV